MQIIVSESPVEDFIMLSTSPLSISILDFYCFSNSTTSDLSTALLQVSSSISFCISKLKAFVSFSKVS